MEVKELKRKEKVGNLEYGTIFKVNQTYFMVVSFCNFNDDDLNEFLFRHQTLAIVLENGEIENFSDDTEVEPVTVPLVLG